MLQTQTAGMPQTQIVTVSQTQTQTAAVSQTQTAAVSQTQTAEVPHTQTAVVSQTQTQTQIETTAVPPDPRPGGHSSATSGSQRTAHTSRSETQLWLFRTGIGLVPSGEGAVSAIWYGERAVATGAAGTVGAAWAGAGAAGAWAVPASMKHMSARLGELVS